MSMATKSVQTSRRSHDRFDVERVRAEFPALQQQVHGKPLIYLDNAATTQKPNAVIDAIADYYRRDNSNVHRGVHALSQRATDAYEAARSRVRTFINADSDQEIIFTRGTTEAINLVASSWGRTNLRAGDEILITGMEHHSNIVPWQILCEQTGAKLRVIPISDAGELDLSAFEQLLSERTRLVGVVHCSNALGTINPVKQIIERAHNAGALVLVDGAQAVSHMTVDVQQLDCDFYAFSAHKLYGPTGIGVLYGKKRHLTAMPPYQSGGDMIKYVTFEKSEYNELPYKFEAGTPHIAGGIALGAAIDYVTSIGLDAIAAHEHELLTYAVDAVRDIKGLKFVGTARDKAGILGFTLDGIHPHDIGTILDNEGVAIRAGHHCAMPVMQRFRVPATARASFGMYNTRADIDALVKGIRRAQEMFGP
ncbi:MAG: cysteine desulfurase [Gammaproteobacteria bacterium]|nr:cysteine desulfurase [Gammaproteobacteria bacterium]